MSGSLIASLMEYVGVAKFATTAEVLDHLRGIAAAKAPGEWIVARNFDRGLWFDEVFSLRVTDPARSLAEAFEIHKIDASPFSHRGKIRCRVVVSATGVDLAAQFFGKAIEAVRNPF
ncbi:MAG: hypothetical protein VW644_02780, partial [Alphaproteobacteria bacterium]